jgi:hypothetical protein
MMPPPSAWRELPRTPYRNCLKSPVGTRNGAAQSTDTVLFGLFWPRYTGQIHARSVAQTPFETVSMRPSENTRPGTSVNFPKFPRILLKRTSENPQKAKFAEFQLHALACIRARGRAEPLLTLRCFQLSRLLRRPRASRYPIGKGAKPSNILS